MNVQTFLYSRLASELAFTLSKSIPEQVGYPLAERVGRFIGKLRHAELRRAVRANQWVVSRRRLSARELDRAAEAVFRFAGYVLYDFYHNLNSPDRIRGRVDYTARARATFQRARSAVQGTLLVLPHMGNFDLVGRALALDGINFQILSYPAPPSGYQVQNQIREAPGIDVTPMSIESMRQAAERLKNGGIVVTGLDRPLTNSNYMPRFFGVPAAMPVAYIRLAIKVGVPVIVAAITRLPSGNYLVDSSDPIPMKPYPDLKTEMERNAEAVLDVAERFILSAPQQWLMFYPVWPNVERETP